MASELGDFLRLSRQRVQPADVRLPAGDRRRVPGLRREEVAMLAGVSVDYYVRLEQGREKSPSAQVTEAIGEALLFDTHAMSHLYRLAGLTPRIASDGEETADADLVALIASLPEHPAIVLGRALDVLATNDLAEALFGAFPYSRNLAESVFLAPDATSFYSDWEVVAENTVAGLRLLHGVDPRNLRIAAVLANLTANSAEFTRMWGDHLARGRRLRSKRFRHPVVGPLTLQIQTFDVRASPGQELVVYRAQDGTPSQHALRALPAAPT